MEDKNERSIRWVYHWLLWSVLITVPWMIFDLLVLEILFYGSGIPAYTLAVLLPACAHGLLLFGLRSPHRYARRHAQQALVLAGLRTLSTVFFVGLTEASGTCLWVLANGFLWIFGTVSGLRQIKRGDCWLMRWLGEGSELPRPWAAVEDGAALADAAPPVPSVPTPAPVVAPAEPTPPPADPNAVFGDGLRLLREGQRSEAAACFLTAFRTGPSDLRDRARAALADLGEVETF